MKGGNVAVIGIGDSQLFRRNSSQKSSLAMALEAILEAAAESGISPEDVDGFCSFGLHGVWASALTDALGTRSFRFAGAPLQLGGAGMLGALQVAVAALESGKCNYVVLFKSLHSGEHRVSNADGYLSVGTSVKYAPGYEETHFGGSFTAPYGVYIPYEGFALSAQRYMHDNRVGPEDTGLVATTLRENAQTNPRARFYGRPLTMAEYLDSEVFADPLRKLDLCVENDFGVAVLLTTMDRAREHLQPPVRISALSYAIDYRGTYGLYGDPSLPNSFLRAAAQRLWSESKYRPGDMKTAQLFDSTTVSVLMQLEDLGFCAPGDGPTFVRAGNIGKAGSLPVNTSGGQLSEAYALGMTVFTEAVRQVRGTSSNQVGGPALMSHSPYSAPAGLVVLDQ